MSILEHISEREGNSTVWNSCAFNFSYEVLAEIINYLLADAIWAIEGQPCVLWVVIAVCDILIPSKVHGLVVLVVLNFWALWSALSNAWCAINMSIEARDGVASGSIENINNYIVATIVAAVMVVMVRVSIVVDNLYWCCVGFDTNGFWSVWLYIFILVSYSVATAGAVRCLSVY